MSNGLTIGEKIIGHVIGRAAPNGVRHAEIAVSDFDPEATKDIAPTFDDAAEWLRREGLIRVKDDPVNDDDRQDIWHYEVVLTAEGFSRLARPHAPNGAVGAAVAAIGRDGRGCADVGDLVGGLLGALAKPISS